jgi:hypothetical protein
MHPLVARIHPSYRTAFVAWFVTRSLLWMTAAASGHAFLSEISASLENFDGGAPAWGLLVHVLSALGDHGPMVLAALGEVALLAATVGVYRFVRRDQLPQTADRATWLWAACPAMVFTLPAADWTFAIALSAVALAALSSSRHIAASVILAGAMAFKPEVMLLWPGFALLGWKNYQPAKQHPASPWVTTLGPPAAFSAVVLGAMSMAGRFGVSLRTLPSGSQWREGLAWQGFSAHVPDFFLLSAAVVGVCLIVTNVKQVPKAWALMAVPCLAWPFLLEPPTAAVATLLLSVPLFGYLARATNDPSLERAVLVGFVGGLMLLMVVGF